MDPTTIEESNARASEPRPSHEPSPVTGAASENGLTAEPPAVPGPVISNVSFQRFKSFKDTSIAIAPGLSLVAGANNGGKSTLLHGLAVWEFCRTATLRERGEDALTNEATLRQGFGLGDDEFSPINVPSLKHLWTNLKTAKTPDDLDGYTLQICCDWESENGTRSLGFSLALANDRLFIKVATSNLVSGDPTPVCAYLPPFAGIRAREERIGGAIRRRRIGEGLAGAILRNLLLDMYQENIRRRSILKGDRHKITEGDLKRLREEDPWELLQQTLRQVFGVEIIVDDFAEDYHSYINVEIVKGTLDGYKLKRFPNYNARDLMVEGSGFLQWLSVYALVVSPGVNVLMFDEPDAHLHPTLQHELLRRLSELAKRSEKQVLVATHSSEILRLASPGSILRVGNDKEPKYLVEEHQKIGMLAGLGASYAPKMDRIRASRKVLFLEGKSDVAILKVIAAKLGISWPSDWVEWITSSPQKERKVLWTAMCEEFGQTEAVSLRDRDDEPLSTIGDDLKDLMFIDHEEKGFHARKWRRRYIESYLLWPAAIAAVSGTPEAVVREKLQEQYAIAIGSSFLDSYAPTSLLDLRAKEILSGFGVTALDVAKELPDDAICKDLSTLLDQLMRHNDD